MELATPRPLATSLALWRGMGVDSERLAAREAEGERLGAAARQALLGEFLRGDLGNLPLAVARLQPLPACTPALSEAPAFVPLPALWSFPTLHSVCQRVSSSCMVSFVCACGKRSRRRF